MANAPLVDADFSAGTNSARAALAELERLQKVTENFQGICERAGEKIVPMIRTELDTCWSRTGLRKEGNFKEAFGDKPGNLYAAWVTASKISVNGRGVYVVQPGGMNRHVYKRSGWFQYGGVRGVAGKGKSAAKFRRKLKAQGQQPNSKLVIQQPRPMRFDAGQIDRIAVAFVAAVNSEIGAM